MSEGQGSDRKAWLESLFRRIGGWRTEVEVRRRELEHRVEIARGAPASPRLEPTLDETIEALTGSTRVTVRLQQEASPPELTQEERNLHADAIDRALGDARIAIESPSTVGSWITGGAVTAAWESIHDAEGELVEIESDGSVRSTLPRLLTWIQDVMKKGSLRERYEKQLGAFIDGSAPVDRTVVRQGYQDVLTANNERHASLRAFRNLVLATSAALFVLLLALAIWHAINPDFVSLCDKAAATPDTASSCLAGVKANGRDLAEVELIGAIAGLLSVAFGLGSVRNAPSRYNVRAPQATLKPIAGAATALIGVLLVQSHILIAPAQTTSEALLLAYAAIFGFSQQLLTQFVDKRAGKLLGTGSADGEPGDAK